MKQKTLFLILLITIICLIVAIALRPKPITDENGNLAIPQNEFLLPIPDDWDVTMTEGEPIESNGMHIFQAMTFYTGLLKKREVGTIYCGQYRSRDLILKDERVGGVLESVTSQNGVDFAVAHTSLNETNSQGETIGILSFRPVDDRVDSYTACELTAEAGIVGAIYSQLINL